MNIFLNQLLVIFLDSLNQLLVHVAVLNQLLVNVVALLLGLAHLRRTCATLNMYCGKVRSLKLK